MATAKTRTTRKSTKKAAAGGGARPATSPTPSDPVSAKIAAHDDWRGETLARMRSLILEAVPDMVEEIKWVKPSNPSGDVVWSHGGLVCTGEVYKSAVKLTFAKGASLPDPAGLFNASLGAGTRRAIDIREGEKVNARAFKALIKAAVAANAASSPARKAAAGKTSAAAKKAPVKLLSGGNPQIAKADGDAPVQAYIAAMPGWKSGLGKRLDAIIVRSAPNVRKAVKWNSPFYGIEGQGWFLSFHVLTRYVKVTFFNGTSLRPIPPGGTPKSQESRWIDIYENDTLDEKQMAAWVKQAAALPGWIP